MTRTDTQRRLHSVDVTAMTSELLLAGLRSTMTLEGEALLAKLPNQLFLNTPYWRIVRELVMRRAERRCADCDGAATHVVHKTFEHRGAEWRHLEDLEARCYHCQWADHSKVVHHLGEAVDGIEEAIEAQG